MAVPVATGVALQLLSRHAMTATRVTMGVLWLMMVLCGLLLWNGSATGPPPAGMRVYTTAIPQDAREPAGIGRRDRYGNDVTEAIGDYRVDPRGDLYEWHNPDTAVLKLGPAGV
jgi:hypothetical protein